MKNKAMLKLLICVGVLFFATGSQAQKIKNIFNSKADIDIFVTNTNDTGLGSLRDAIQQANITPGKNIISFQIPKSD